MYGCVMNQKKISVETELLLCVANTTRFERDSHIFYYLQASSAIPQQQKGRKRTFAKQQRRHDVAHATCKSVQWQSKSQIAVYSSGESPSCLYFKLIPFISLKKKQITKGKYSNQQHKGWVVAYMIALYGIFFGAFVNCEVIAGNQVISG